MVTGLYFYIGCLLLQCYTCYGWPSLLACLAITGAAVLVVVAVWTDIVLALQCDDGIWVKYRWAIRRCRAWGVGPPGMAFRHCLDHNPCTRRGSHWKEIAGFEATRMVSSSF